MSEQKYICSGSKLTALADAIRAKAKTTGTYTLDQMSTAINNLASVEKIGSGDYFWGWYSDSSAKNKLTDNQAATNIINGTKVYAKFDTYINPSSVLWASSSDSDVLTMVKAAQAGKFNLSDYWSVGDTRSVSLSAMAATGVGESHVAQTVEVVLMDFQQLYSYSDGSGKCKVVWGLKNGLANGTSGEYGYMNSSDTNTGGWASCARRTWCNNVFYRALPSWMQAATKQVNVVAANGSSSTTATSQDMCFLPAEKEIFGSNSYANSTAESALKQWTWYATASNRIKKCGASGSASVWWERSPGSGGSDSFCSVYSGGSARGNSASYTLLLAPCGCF